MAGTSGSTTTGTFFSTARLLAAGALAGAAFFAPLLGAALTAGFFASFALLALVVLAFLLLSSTFPFLVSFFVALLAGDLEGFSALPVYLGADLVVLVSFFALASFFSSDFVFFGFAASSAFNLAVYAILSFSYLALSN